MKKTDAYQSALNDFWRAIDSICKDYKPEDKKTQQKALKQRIKGDAGMPAGQFNESKEFEL